MISDHRQYVHLEALKGWINDPNGLCFCNGKYHVFFQYSPDSPYGDTLRCWGHFESCDEAKSWTYTGIALRPDIPEDRSGVFSGSAVVSDNKIHIFYTGNVDDGGVREAYQIYVTMEDGIHMSDKKVILKPSDYPGSCSCEVRDPKVWIEDGKWKMVLGAKDKDGKGCVLLYEADSPDDWHFVRQLSKDGLGYMWECPDMFELGGQTFLGVSPQGLEHEEYRYQNVYSSGFFRMEEGELKDFIEYDYGFDFYAPQTFVNEYGERILIGWMGIGDIPYTNPTAEKGWQHCLTIPRKLSVTDDGALRQWPVIHHELYGSMEEVRDGEEKKIKLPCDIVAVIESDPYTLKIDGAEISYDDNELVLDLSHGDVGQGRTVRKVKTGKHKTLRIIADRSSLEVFISGGRYVMSTRFYPSDDEVLISAKGGGFIVRDISRMEINGFE